MDPNLVSIDIADTSNYTSIPRSNSFDTGIDSHSSELLDVPVKINIVDNDADGQPIISNVEEELGLTQYTDNHFTSITNKDLERIRNSYTAPLTVPEENLIIYKSSSNSPVLSVLDSNRGSRSNSDEEPETNVSRNNTDISYRTYHKRRYNKLNYRDVERSISKYYKQNQSNALYSNEMDILTTYVKGQKHLYIQSKLLTQQKLNCLVFPAIIISAVITIISPFVECKSWNVGIISGLNAIVTLFISLMNLLKYESSTEMYSLLASLFDNIETSIELTGRKLTIMQQQDNDTTHAIISKFNDVETRISDYKLTNAVLIPEEIKRLFPVISHINIFSFIKKTDLHRKMLIEKLRDIKNEIYFILYKWEKEEKYAQKHNLAFNAPPSPAARATTQRERERERLTYLYILKDNTKNEIIEFQNTYSVMDTIFNREILGAERHRNNWLGYLFCDYCKSHTPSYDYLDGIAPILADYFSNIINEFTVHKLTLRGEV
jgi:hypothetical protein